VKKCHFGTFHSIKTKVKWQMGEKHLSGGRLSSLAKARCGGDSYPKFFTSKKPLSGSIA